MNWKKISFWSGIGGVVFGTAVYALKKSAPQSQLFPETIPKGVRRVLIELTPAAAPDSDPPRYTQQCYLCEPTSFFVWSVLPTSRLAGKPGGQGVVVTQTQGMQIFFVVPTLLSWEGEPDAPPDFSSGTLGEPFYATLRVHTELPLKPLISQIARDYPLAFHKCLVGGSPNGIETGEILITRQAVMDYRFDVTEA